MSFSVNLARKYINAQKRSTVFMILSTTAAVALITVIFTVYSTFNKCMKNMVKLIDPWHATVYGLTEEQFEKNYTSYFPFTRYYADLADKSGYSQATAFIDRNAMEIAQNNYSENLKINKTLETVRIFGYSLMMFIAIIAVINMVNVISIGIIKRKKEFASLKSLGMSGGQFRKIILGECLQYTLISGIASVILTSALFALLLSTIDLTGMDEELIPNISVITSSFPFVRYGLEAMVAAFVVCLAASVLPMRNIEKSAITESMRSID